MGSLMNIVNRVCHVFAIINILLVLLIHLGNNELVVTKTFFQFGKKVVVDLGTDKSRNWEENY